MSDLPPGATTETREQPPVSSPTSTAAGPAPIAPELVDRCAPELPDRRGLFLRTGRNAQVDPGIPAHRERAGSILPRPAPMVARPSSSCARCGRCTSLPTRHRCLGRSCNLAIDDDAIAAISPSLSFGPPQLLLTNCLQPKGRPHAPSHIRPTAPHPVRLPANRARSG